MARCPTCGHLLQQGMDAQELVKVLQEAPEKYVYEGRDQNWYVTSTPNSRVQKNALDALIKSGKLRRKYSDMNGAWTTGRTIDVPATREARRQKRLSKFGLIYTPDPSP